jgi:hypothetical protein
VVTDSLTLVRDALRAKRQSLSVHENAMKHHLLQQEEFCSEKNLEE